MKILLIDDDINLCKVIAYQLEKNNFEVITANSGNAGLEKFKNNEVDIVISDIQMGDISGIDVLNKIRKMNKKVIIIMITAYGSVENAINACHLGADDYLSKPFGQEQLLFSIEKAVRFRNLQKENKLLKNQLQSKFQFGNIISQSVSMKQVLEMAEQVANSETTVLLQGESGTGKEVLAKSIHFNSNKKDKPFITVNCPSIPDNLIESELFGHMKGAFTGAIKDRIGKFEQAKKGTIFLDEIGDLKDSLQAKLLRVIQEKEIEPVGGSKTIPIDVRIIAATNKDLQQMVKDFTFREDLYYRLSVFPITLPQLKERKEDIPYLTDYFIKQYGQGKGYQIEDEFINKLQEYNWPGNVRELENLIERALILAKNYQLTVKELPSSVSGLTRKNINTPVFQIPDEGIGLEEIEKTVINETLERLNGNQTKTAKFLKIPRHVLLYKMKKFKI